MASLIWLIVWLASGRPNVEWFGTWTDWAVALLGCIVFDVFSGREAAGASRRRTPIERPTDADTTGSTAPGE